MVNIFLSFPDVDSHRPAVIKFPNKIGKNVVKFPKKIGKYIWKLQYKSVFFAQLEKFYYLCIVHTHAFGRNGWDGDILESVIDALFLAI